MNREEYRQLIDDYITESDKLIPDIRIEDNGEPLVSLLSIPQLVCERNDSFCRTTVKNKLQDICEKLLKRGLALRVFQAWRAPARQSLQRELWIEYLLRKNPHMTKRDLEVDASLAVAPMAISPHCTGGAVDLTVYDINTGVNLDMGTEYDDFSLESYTTCPDLPLAVKNNRILLLELMEAADFSNLPSEWWHFSFGNSEWAAFKGKSRACYAIIPTR